MSHVPDWVPSEAIQFREEADTGPKGYALWGKEDLPVLDKIIASRNMEPAWNAVEKRRSTSNPRLFAEAVLYVSYLYRRMDDYPQQSDIAALRRLAKETRSLASDLKRDAKSTLKSDWNDWRSEMLLKKIFKIPPLKALKEFALYLDATARDKEETRTELTAYAGKPGTKDAERAFVVRHLSEQMLELYQQPLHDTVAKTSSEILEEPITREQVRSLVRAHSRLELPYWAG